MFSYNTIDEALEDLRKGRIILVTDDDDRENEGDFICAAQFATTENINFMATHGKGLICMPMSTVPSDVVCCFFDFFKPLFRGRVYRALIDAWEEHFHRLVLKRTGMR